MFVFLLLSLTGSTLAQSAALLASTTHCGFQHPDDYEHDDHIGIALPDEFPWLASLVYQYPDGVKVMLCSGTLINTQYVITAAQCIAYPKETVLVGVRLGEYHKKNKTDCYIDESAKTSTCSDVVDMGIDKKIIHPHYNSNTRENDIALIRLAKELKEYGEHIRPICIYKGRTLSKPGDTLYISGFGRASAVEEPVDMKKRIAVSVVANDECQKKYPNSLVKDSQLCTQDMEENSVFTCKGDAGAPVMIKLGKVPQWYLEGVVSWGQGCGSSAMHVHTRVSAYGRWIEANLNQ